MKKMVHILRNLGELYRGRRAMGRKYVVAGLSVIAKSDVSKRNSLHITPSDHSIYVVTKMAWIVFKSPKHLLPLFIFFKYAPEDPGDRKNIRLN